MWLRYHLLNGTSGVYGYIEQYFDKAYRVGTNGNVTATETGILSPYGYFFPTEPGPVALLTMPNIENGQRGTGVVNVIKQELDVNHDGTMDLSFAGPDNTSQARPFVFWINNDYDRLPGLMGATLSRMTWRGLTALFIPARRMVIWIALSMATKASRLFLAHATWRITPGYGCPACLPSWP